MAVTYNNYSTTDVGFIKRYDASAGTWSDNLYGSSVFDYFDDDCTVGDYIIFGGSDSGGNYGNRPIWRGIKLYVGTAFAATSYTIVWEYANKSGVWTPLPNLSDGTNGFATTGENIVMHDPLPIYSRIYPSTGEGAAHNTCTWIRARLTAVDTPTEGGAQSTQEVEVGDHRIYIDGYSEGTPCTLDDVYNADVTGSWGVVTKQNNAYTITAHFKVNEDGYFKSTQEMMQLGTPSYGGLHWLFEGNAQFGEKDATTGKGYNGSYLRKIKVSTNTWSASFSPQSFKFYGGLYQSDLSYGHGMYMSGGGTIEFIDSVLGSAPSFRGTFTTLIVERCTFIGGGSSYLSDAMVLGVTNAVLNDTLFINKTGGDYLLCTVGTSILEDCKFAGTPPFINCHLIGQAGDTTFINPEGFTLDDLEWDISRSIEQYFTLKYSIKLKVLDASGNAISGATVSFAGLYNDEIEDQTTSETGEISEQDITYCKAQGIANPTGTYYANPLTVTLSKSGYITQTHKITMDEKKDLVFTLEEQVPVIIAKGEAAVNTAPEDITNMIYV